MTHPAEQQPPAPASGPGHPGSGHPAPPVYAMPGPGYAPAPGHGPPPGGYPVPPSAVPGYGYPPGGVRHPRPVASGGAPLAEFWQRLLAYLLDSLILGAALIIPLAVIFGAIFGSYFMSIGPGTEPDPMHLMLLYVLALTNVVLLNLIASYVYFVRMFHKTGQTIGKRIMQIRVVRAVDGGPLDLRAAKRRWVVQHAAAVVAVYFNLADGLWQLWDQPYQQCLHDKCAETVVVRVAA